MRAGTLAFFLGVLALVQCPQLPAAPVELLPACVVLAVAQPRLRAILLFAAGFLYALAYAHSLLLHEFPAALEGKSLTVVGEVVSLPEHLPKRSRFDFRIDQLESPTAGIKLPQRVRISWYQPRTVVNAGDRWRLRLRLKRPHGFFNRGGFDYEGWLFQRGIQATGYVRDSRANRRLAAAGVGLQPLRAELRDRIQTILGDGRAAALVIALAIGDRGGLDAADWRVLRASGTSHLLAISGLHIGLIAALLFFPARALWSLFTAATRFIPAQRAAVVLALSGASVYAMLAGFSIPTRRALVMLAVVTIAVFCRRHLWLTDGLLIALLAVVLLDPFAVLAAGFWLSFLAVAVIAWGVGGREPQTGIWVRYGRVQCLIALGLLPVLLYWFQEYPLLGALANLVAVPWVSLAVVPLVLSGMLVLIAWPVAGAWLLWLAARALDGLWWWLELLVNSDLAVLARPQPMFLFLLAGLFGAALLLLPRAVPARWIGLLWLLPLFWPAVPRPDTGEYRLAVLDVGQGLAVTVETRNHVLVYDTGARFSDRFDAGSAVVVPYLRYRGHASIDTLIVSHGDNDHRGGLSAILAVLPVDTLVSSVPREMPAGTRGCRRGQHWNWDGVVFEMLHPTRVVGTSANDQSCVLRITGKGGTALLPGDISDGVEQALVRHPAVTLRADVLVAPHHGSRSSSTLRFIEAVAPDYTVFSTGYRNRYDFPNSDIIERYRHQGATLYNTATAGAVEFRFHDEGIRVESVRRTERRFWNR